MLNEEPSNDRDASDDACECQCRYWDSDVRQHYAVAVPTVHGVGSFVQTTVSTSPTEVVDGSTYGGTNYSEFRDAAGHLTSRTYAESETTATCRYAPAEPLFPFPLHVGQSWSADWTATCSDGSVLNYRLTGGPVVHEEKITIPAGTFDTLQLRYPIRLTSTASAIVQDISFAIWIDVDTSEEIQLQKTYVYIGATPGSGYEAASSTQLLSAP